MNRPKLVRFNDTIVITARILASTFQLDLICCWSVWRYIIIIRCICNSYSIILKYNSTHRLALDEQESFCISTTILYFKLLFVYLMPKNVDCIHKNSHEEVLPHTLLEVASSSYIVVKSFNCLFIISHHVLFGCWIPRI